MQADGGGGLYLWGLRLTQDAQSRAVQDRELSWWLHKSAQLVLSVAMCSTLGMRLRYLCVVDSFAPPM